MMHVDLMYAMFVGLSIAWLWGLVLNTRGPWDSFFLFFVVLSMSSWGGGVWVTPFGPAGWGVSWLPFVLIGVCVALLLSAATPHPARRRLASKAQASPAANLKEQAPETGPDAFFWILIVVLAGIIICHYVWHPHHVK